MSAFSRASRRTDPSAGDLLPPSRRPLPASPRPMRRPDAVDAVFEVIPAGRAPMLPTVNDNRRGVIAAQPQQLARTGVGLLLRGEAGLGRLSVRSFFLLTGGLCAAAFLAVAGFSPEAQRPVALDIGEVTTVLSDAGGLRVMTVYGAVVNRTGEGQTIPPISVNLVSGGRSMRAEGRPVATGMIAPGEHRRFSARLAYSGSTVPAVKISFAPMGAPLSGL